MAGRGACRGQDRVESGSRGASRGQDRVESGSRRACRGQDRQEAGRGKRLENTNTRQSVMKNAIKDLCSLVITQTMITLNLKDSGSF